MQFRSVLALSALVCSVAVAQNINPNNLVAGQGTIPRVFQAPEIAGAANVGLVGSSYVAQIVYGAASTALGTPIAFRNIATTAGNAGRWASVDLATIPGVAAGEVVSLQVRVWDSSVFSSWDAASAVLNDPSTYTGTTATQAGASTSFNYTVGTASNPASLVAMANFPGLTLTHIPAVPEPTTIALGALGAAALLWRRRK